MNHSYLPINTTISQHVDLADSFTFDALCAYSLQVKQNHLKTIKTRFIGWQEIVFLLCDNPNRWRFMGVSVNILSADKKPQEIVSSIFRHNPTIEIACPWTAVYSFCETSLQIPIGRVVLPFVKVFQADGKGSHFHRLLQFDYRNLDWKVPVMPLAERC